MNKSFKITIKNIVQSLLFVFLIIIVISGIIYTECESIDMLSDDQLMALCIYVEARGEGREGMMGVGNVILNRTECPERFGKTIREVILKRKQFSGMSNKSLKRNRYATLIASLDSTYNKSYLKCLATARDIMDNKGYDNTFGSNHYCTVDCFPYWSKGQRVIVVIGNHKFFKIK
jgi:spore germination cell wall hydrolase CwlJ-like protein